MKPKSGPISKIILGCALGIWGAAAPLPALAEQAKVFFCEPANSVGARVAGCTENKVFITAAESCLEKLNQEEARLGGQIVEASRIVKGAQHGEIKTGEDANKSAFAAMNSLSAQAQIALQQMNEYDKYVAIPPLTEAPSLQAIALKPESWFKQVSCYREATEGIQRVRSELKRKTAMYADRAKEASEHVEQLQTSGAALEARNPANKGAKSTRAKGSPKRSSAKKIPFNRQSDISGTTPPKGTQ